MPKINDIFKHTRGLKNLVSKTNQYLNLKKEWKLIFGTLHNQFTLEFLRDQTLIISTKNYNWVTEIEALKPLIIKKANDVLNRKHVIKDIKIVVDQAEKPKKKKPVKLISNELKDLITEENRRKQNLGYTLCHNCTNILTKQDICTTCRADLV